MQTNQALMDGFDELGERGATFRFPESLVLEPTNLAGRGEKQIMSSAGSNPTRQAAIIHPFAAFVQGLKRGEARVEKNYCAQFPPHEGVHG